jgi:hypothetical protein
LRHKHQHDWRIISFGRSVAHSSPAIIPSLDRGGLAVRREQQQRQASVVPGEDCIDRVFAARLSDSPVGSPAASLVVAQWTDLGGDPESPRFIAPLHIHHVGGGNSALPDKVRTPLQLLHERRFRSGVVHLHYRISV